VVLISLQFARMVMCGSLSHVRVGPPSARDPVQVESKALVSFGLWMANFFSFLASIGIFKIIYVFKTLL